MVEIKATEHLVEIFHTRTGNSVRHFHTSRLLHTLKLARQKANYTALLRSLARTDLLILDDWMHDPLSQSNSQDILEILDDCFDHASTIVIAQLPVAAWFA